MVGLWVPAANLVDHSARIAHHVLDVVGAQEHYIERRRNVEPMERQDPVLAAFQILCCRQTLAPHVFQQLLKSFFSRLRVLDST